MTLLHQCVHCSLDGLQSWWIAKDVSTHQLINLILSRSTSRISGKYSVPLMYLSKCFSLPQSSSSLGTRTLVHMNATVVATSHLYLMVANSICTMAWCNAQALSSSSSFLLLSSLVSNNRSVAGWAALPVNGSGNIQSPFSRKAPLKSLLFLCWRNWYSSQSNHAFFLSTLVHYFRSTWTNLWSLSPLWHPHGIFSNHLHAMWW